MIRHILIALLTFVTFSASAAEIPIDVTPFYSSDEPTIAVGEFSDRLKAADPAALLSTASSMKEELDTLPVEAMYVAAIRLYEVGLKEEAVYWFYAAQFRSRLFQGVIEEPEASSVGDADFELRHAFNSFFELAGPTINGYAFCDQELITETLGQVIRDSEELPQLSVIYPEVRFISKDRWEQIAHEIRAGLDKFVEHIKTGYPEMKKERDARGLTEKFCGSDN